jgi:Glycosyltransferase family 87
LSARVAVGGAPAPRGVVARRGAAVAGGCALAVMLAGSLVLALVAAGGPSTLVPRSRVDFPDWLAGPLHPLADGISLTPYATGILFSAVLVAMTLAYGVVLACARSLRARVAIAAIAALHVIWLLAPTMPLTDVFNYLAYARLGVVHGLSPYTHVLAAAPRDPAFHFTTWRHLLTPYGPLFTLASGAIALLPLPLAYWALKLAIVAASLGCVALVWRCARQLGRAPLPPVLLLAVNPLVLVYGLGGFHNDVLMLLPLLAAVSLVLARREAAAGVAGMAAVAVKASAGVLLPFLLLGARRRGRLAAGAALAALVLAGVSWAVFGLALPNLGDQTSLVTPFSVPNTVGQIAGLGGAPPWLRQLSSLLAAGAVAILLVQVWRGRIPWLDGAAWAVLALIVSLAWLVPWYVMWLLPLAGLASSRAPRRGALVLTLYLVLTFAPVTWMLLSSAGYRPFDSPVGRAILAEGHRLSH